MKPQNGLEVIEIIGLCSGNNSNGKIHFYEALFLVDPLIKTVSESVRVFNVEVFDDVPEEYSEAIKEHRFEKAGEFEGHEYVLIKKIKAFDHQTARSAAERKIDNLSDLYSLFIIRAKSPGNERP